MKEAVEVEKAELHYCTKEMVMVSRELTNPDFVNIVTRNPSLKPFGIPQTMFGTFSDRLEA
jgi:hypothetical protein